MWKVLFQSVRGPAHENSGQPCQDRCRVRLRGADSLLVCACADGAGSAPLSHLGAELTCRDIIRLVFDDFREGLTLQTVERDTVVSWYQRLQPLLQTEATRYEVPLSSLATTLLLAVVGTDRAVFGQVGDGAIVADGQIVFWPQIGEYINTTNFITQEDVGQQVLFERCERRVDELALFTDGIQNMALRFAERQVHQPFFQPMFQRLRAAKPGENLALALRRFLDSAPVRERSEDDKTLILATRML